MDDLITYLMNRSPAMRAAFGGKALVMDPSRLRSNEPFPLCSVGFPTIVTSAEQLKLREARNGSGATSATKLTVNNPAELRLCR